MNWDKFLSILTYFKEISLHTMLGLFMSVIHLAPNQKIRRYRGELN